MGRPFQGYDRFLRERWRNTRYPLTAVPCATALGAVLLGVLATVFLPAGAGASRTVEPAMVEPVSSRDSPAAAVQGVEIHFDEVVAAGEIPPPEREYAADLDSAVQAALRLQRSCRFVHGTIAGDADFEICLPVKGWNGKLVVWAPGGLRSEFQGSFVLRPPALAQGYAYASTDLGLSLSTLVRPENRIADARPRVVEVTRYAEELADQHYGKGPPERTYAAGNSFGAYLTTRLLEEHPDLYDGGIRHAGANSLFQALGAFATWLRHWDERPVSPLMYDVGARLPNGFRYRLGQERGTEDRWEAAAPRWRSLLSPMIRALDPSYDPDGDDSLSPSEIEAWTAEDRPDEVRGRLAETAVTGRLGRKLIVFSGLDDVLSPPSVDRAYRRLVEETTGPGRVMLYLKPGAGHGHGVPVHLDADGNPVGFWPDALRALDEWVEKGEEPGAIADLSPR